MPRPIFLATTAVLTGACLVQPTQPVASQPGQSARTVSQLYDDTCAKCHGQRAEGGGAGTKTLLTEDKFDQKWDEPFFRAIKEGVPDMGMEAYSPGFTDEQIWALVVHIRELQEKGLREKNGSPKPTGGVYHSRLENFKVETVLDHGLKTPWSLDWLPDGRMLVTNRPGTLVVVTKGEVTGDVKGLPPSIEQGQGGLMEVGVSPHYEKDGWVYLTVADPAKNGDGALTRVVRGKIDFSETEPRWAAQQTVYEAPQSYYSRAGIHFGSKIAFDGKGHLFFSVGERGTNMRAQDTATPYGKIMRLNEDGTVPADNPIAGNPMWSYGHRNPQGLAFDSEGRLWDTEHAPRGGDELNLIEKGKNYGWPVVCFGINYNDTPFRVPWPKPEQSITMPVLRWLPSIATSGLALVKGKAFPAWDGDLLAGGLAGRTVRRLRVKSGELLEQEEVLHGLGRVRDIRVAADGSVYVVLNEPDKIIRLIPAQ